MTNWPFTLPQSMRLSGFNRGLPDNRLRSQNDVGPAKVRRRASLAPYPISGDMIMTREQWGLLADFVNRTTGGGTLPFYFPDPFTFDQMGIVIDFADTPTATVAGSPLLVRFGSALPAISEDLGEYVRVDIELEIMPGPNDDFDGPVADFLTVSRSSTATYWDSNGTMQTAAPNVLRLDHDPATGEPLGAFIERQATNLALQSGNLSIAPWAWGEGGASTIEPGDPAPIAGETFWRITKDDSFSDRRQGVALPTSTSRFTASVFAKRGNVDVTRWWISLGGTLNGTAEFSFNFSTGQIVGAPGTAGNITLNAFGAIPIGDGIYRFWMDITPGNSTLAIVLLANNTGGTGDQHQYWGYELELGGGAPSSYIPTTAAQATRAADIVTKDLGGLPFSDDEGTLLIEAQDQHVFPTSGIRYYGGVTPGSGTSSYFGIGLYSTGHIGARSFGSSTPTLPYVPGQKRMAVAWGGGDLAFSINGSPVQRTSLSQAQSGLTLLTIGSLAQGASFVAGCHIKRIELRALCLTDAELQQMTA
ncbi:hypothetical protein [Chelativorans sp. AA-79]|uniref:phage head spike fiber domain-containing protein n=1 Tax=Chelativorans sp. AA-79 TaxID=3028735 RepID=UPI0023F6CD29|nr:hypothetical protein [Chelativorans sp. AA-79]WEX07368.1 hypothetical protein PVE73_14685 [Chelativorans sp. AA-79]